MYYKYLTFFLIIFDLNVYNYLFLLFYEEFTKINIIFFYKIYYIIKKEYALLFINKAIPHSNL